MAGVQTFILPDADERLVTSGSRGTPELDFDMINQVQQHVQTQVAETQMKAGKQAVDLESMLTGVNNTLRQKKASFRDTKVMFANQANQLAEESDQLTQKIYEARSDPFNSLKALFTDEKSVSELAAEHNRVQNRMNQVRRRFTSEASGFNFDIGQAASELKFAQSKLQLTRGNLQQLGQASNVLSAVVQSRSQLFQQQISTMLEPDLIAELEDPKGTIPKGLIQDRLLLLKQAKAALKTSRSGRQKSQLELAKMAAEFIEKHGSFLSEAVVNRALSLPPGQTITDPFTGLAIDAQTAKLAQSVQRTTEQERIKLNKGFIENHIQGQTALTGSFATIARASGVTNPAALFNLNEKGEVVDLNRDVIPPALLKVTAELQETKMLKDSFDFQLDFDDKLQPQERASLQEAKLAANQRAIELEEEVKKIAKEQATRGMKNEQAIAGVEEWVETNQISNTESAKQILMENAVATIPGTTIAGELAGTTAIQAHGYGWDRGVEVLHGEFNKQWKNKVGGAGIKFDDDGKPDSESLLSAVLTSGTQASELGNAAFLEAAQTMTENGAANAVMAATLDDWQEIAVNRIVQHVKRQHATEPETVKMLESLVIGQVALDPTITQLQDAEGKQIDALLTFFATLNLKEQELKDKGVLPPESNLVRDIHGYMLGNPITPETRTVGPDGRKYTIPPQSIFEMPEIKSMLRPSTAVGAGINSIFFKNQAPQIFQASMGTIARQVPIDTFPLAQTILEKEQELQSVTGAVGQEGRKAQLLDEIQTLKQQQGGESMTGVLQSIMQRQGN